MNTGSNRSGRRNRKRRAGSKKRRYKGGEVTGKTEHKNTAAQTRLDKKTTHKKRIRSITFRESIRVRNKMNNSRKAFLRTEEAREREVRGDTAKSVPRPLVKTTLSENVPHRLDASLATWA
jgi:hypothetical protein